MKSNKDKTRKKKNYVSTVFLSKASRPPLKTGNEIRKLGGEKTNQLDCPLECPMTLRWVEWSTLKRSQGGAKPRRHGRFRQDKKVPNLGLEPHPLDAEEKLGTMRGRRNPEV